MTRRMLAAIANPHTDVLGHCTGRDWSPAAGPATRPESQFDAERVFAACAEHGVAVEINSRPERLDPPRRLLRLAVDAGCLFAIDTDAHAPGSARLAAATAARGPRRAACRPSGSSTPGRSTGCWRGRDESERETAAGPQGDQGVDPDPGLAGGAD